jgi:hypothetical protein
MTDGHANPLISLRFRQTPAPIERQRGVAGSGTSPIPPFFHISPYPHYLPV